MKQTYFHGNTHCATVQIHQTQIRIRIALRAINFDGASDSHLDGLRKYELGEGVDVEFFRVRREELTEETLECDAGRNRQYCTIAMI